MEKLAHKNQRVITVYSYRILTVIIFKTTMAEYRNLRVFLSYAHADVEPVRKLNEELIEQGYDVWFDEESLVPGQDWRVEIEKTYTVQTQ